MWRFFFQGKEIICPLEKTFDNEVGQLKVQRQGKKKLKVIFQAIMIILKRPAGLFVHFCRWSS